MQENDKKKKKKKQVLKTLKKNLHLSTCKKITKKKISLKGIKNYNMQINHKKYQILKKS